MAAVINYSQDIRQRRLPQATSKDMGMDIYRYTIDYGANEPTKMKDLKRNSEYYYGREMFLRDNLSNIKSLFELEKMPNELSRVSELATRAIENYNYRRNSNYKFEKVLQAHSDRYNGSLYYITFQVKNQDAEKGPCEIFQAKVLPFSGGHPDGVALCRRKLKLI